MSLQLSNYEDRQRHKADISKLTLNPDERKVFMKILQHQLMNGESDEKIAITIGLINNSKDKVAIIPGVNDGTTP
tara:strand:+ start:247 stop:471 length:225 start_codon:yes stop_codon:yes gene_type:complete